VTNNGLALEHVPSNFKTYDVCKLAVFENHAAIKFVPLEHQTQELCELSVSRYPANMQYILKPSEELIIRIVTETPYAIKYIAEGSITESLKYKLITMKPIIIKFLDNPSVFLQLASLIESSNVNNMQNKSIYMYIMAVLVNLNTLDHVDNDMLIRLKNNKILNKFPGLKFIINKTISDNDNKYAHNYEYERHDYYGGCNY